MSDNVVALPPRESRPRAIWICACGCRSMNLLADGNAECAACDALVSADRGGWQEAVATEETYDGKVTPYEAVNFGDDEVAEHFARRRVLDRGQNEDAVAIVVVFRDGTISTWSPIADKKQHSWLKNRLSAAWLPMKPGGPGA